MARRLSAFRSLGAVALACGWALSLGAQALPRVAILPFVGPDAAALERSAFRGLAGHRDVEPIGASTVRAALAKSHQSLKNRRLVADTARLLSAQRVLRGVSRAGQVVVVLYSNRGEELDRTSFPRRSASRLISESLYARFCDALQPAPPPPLISRPVAVAPPTSSFPQTTATPSAAPSPAPVSPPSPPPPPAVMTPAAPVAEATAAPKPSPLATAPAARTSPVFELAVGGGTLTRNLTYSQDLFGSLGGYTLGAGATVSGSLGLYPGAAWTSGFLANLGVVATASHTLGAGSQGSSGENYPTLGDSWLAALRVRVPFDGFELGARVGYGQQELRFGVVPGSAAPPVPNYSYGFIPGLLDVRVDLGRTVALAGNGGYLFVTSDGIAQSGYFPRATVGGIQAGLTLIIAIYRPVELRLGADYQRFFLAMNSKPGDANVAGGAVDQYLESTLALAISIR